LRTIIGYYAGNSVGLFYPNIWNFDSRLGKAQATARGLAVVCRAVENVGAKAWFWLGTSFWLGFSARGLAKKTTLATGIYCTGAQSVLGQNPILLSQFQLLWKRLHLIAKNAAWQMGVSFDCAPHLEQPVLFWKESFKVRFCNINMEYRNRAFCPKPQPSDYMVIGN
jgi:hypothetical protein